MTIRIIMSPYAGAVSNLISVGVIHVPGEAHRIVSCGSYPYLVVFGSWSKLVSGV